MRAAVGVQGAANVQRIDIEGQRFGSWVVLAPAGMRYSPSRNGRMLWRCRCDCGAEADVSSHSLRYGGSTRCRVCARQAAAAYGRRKASVKLPNGWTVAQVALAHGLPLDTVYGRWRRGWPVGELSRPVGKGHGGKGLGVGHRIRPPVTRGA